MSFLPQPLLPFARCISVLLTTSAALGPRWWGERPGMGDEEVVQCEVVCGRG